MGINDGKFYDARLSREYYEGLRKSRRDFDTKADLVRGAQDAFDINELYSGEAASAHKKFIKHGCGKMLNDDTTMMAEMIRHQEYVMSTFEAMVDANPNARIEIDTLEKINVDFKAFYSRFRELTEKTHKVVSDLDAEFGGEIGGFPYPDGHRALAPLIDICGGDDAGAGYFKECQNKLIDYDNEIHSYLKSQDIPFNTDNLNKRITAVKNLIGAYAYSDPKADDFKVSELDSAKIKEIKVMNKNFDEFCQGVDKYFAENYDEKTVFGEAGDEHGSFTYSFDMIEKSKSPLAEAILASPYYGLVKSMVINNAQMDPANPGAYKINPSDAVVAFGVGGAAKSFAEKGNLSDLGLDVRANYEAFKQGGTTFMVDNLARTCNMPGATYMPYGSSTVGNASFINLADYQKVANNSALPTAASVQGLLNENTASAGMNGQVTNLWNTMRATLGIGGVAGATLGNLFQSFGYISVFGSSFFGNKSIGAVADSAQDNVVDAVKSFITSLFGEQQDQQTQKTIDDYPEYKTGDAKVDAKIVKILEENGEDLSGLDERIWNDADETTKRALAKLLDVNCAYLNTNVENCEEYEVRVENLLKSLRNTSRNESEDSYVHEYVMEDGKIVDQYVTGTRVFNNDNVSALKQYMNDDTAKAIISKIENTISPAETLLDHKFDVSKRGAGIEIEMDGFNKLVYYQSDEGVESTVNYWWEKKGYQYNARFFNKDQVTGMYKAAENGDDAEFIDDLLRTDGSYRDVFDVNPDNLSSGMTLVFGNYGNKLASVARGKTWPDPVPYNNFLSAMVTYQDYADKDKIIAGLGFDTYAKAYADKYCVAAQATERLYLDLANDSNPYDGIDIDIGMTEDELRENLETASYNRRTAFGVRNAVNSAPGYIDGLEIDVDVNGGCINVTEIDAELRQQVENGPYELMIDKKDPYSISLKHARGLTAVDDLTHANIISLAEERKKLEEDLPADVALGIVGIFNPQAAEAIGIMRDLLNGDPNSFIQKGDEKVDALLEKHPMLSKGKEGVTTMYDLYSDYEDKVGEIDERIKKLEDMSTVTGLASSTSCWNKEYNCEEYYLEVDNLKTIRFKQKWEHEGINAVYEDGGKNLHELEEKKAKLINDVCNDLALNTGGKFDPNDSENREQVEKALNTMLYGVDSEKKTYKTITDIPNNVSKCCEDNINRTLYGDNLDEGDGIADQVNMRIYGKTNPDAELVNEADASTEPTEDQAG